MLSKIDQHCINLSIKKGYLTLFRYLSHMYKNYDVYTIIELCIKHNHRYIFSYIEEKHSFKDYNFVLSCSIKYDNTYFASHALLHEAETPNIDDYTNDVSLNMISCLNKHGCNFFI